MEITLDLLKQAVKEGMVEALNERDDQWLEPMEDAAMAKAIEEGQKTELVSEQQIMNVLQEKR